MYSGGTFRSQVKIRLKPCNAFENKRFLPLSPQQRRTPISCNLPAAANRGETLKRASEHVLIDRILGKFHTRGRAPGVIGPGDDAAVIAPRSGMQWVVSCDSFFADTHFLPDIHPPDVVGYKALARATSDLAAMGAAPLYFLLALALPPSHTGKWLDRMLAGMARAARGLGLQLIGGDTSAQKVISLSLTVIGEVRRGQAVTRQGARPGDLLFISGVLGKARLGLELIRRNFWRRKSLTRILRAHYFPQPRIALGQWLARNRLASAMIDLSDGLSTDLHNLCGAGGVGARIRADRIPRVASPAIREARLDALELALHGGDDYELLFAVPRRLSHRIPRRYQHVALTCIGEITKQKAIRVETSSGSSQPLRAHGWDPFRDQ